MTDREWTRANMLGPQIPDEMVANMVRMLFRDQLDHEFVCTLARDRIRVLMAEKESLEKQLQAIAARADH